ncbi:MAG: hypothetical protein KGM43_07755 [Planctomycetota bacterium]|nr:hypothetical protein [Planctomycetota bacterium]
MSLCFTVGGTRETFDESYATEVACLLDNAFGAEGDWEGVAPRRFGALDRDLWAEFRGRAVATLGVDESTNVQALGESGHGVFLPSPLQAVSLRLKAGDHLHCASLPGLRNELEELAKRWELPLHDEGLEAIVREQTEGGVADSPEVVVFAHLALAANEAVRRDCPLWIVG